MSKKEAMARDIKAWEVIASQTRGAVKLSALVKIAQIKREMGAA